MLQNGLHPIHRRARRRGGFQDDQIARAQVRHNRFRRRNHIAHIGRLIGIDGGGDCNDKSIGWRRFVRYFEIARCHRSSHQRAQPWLLYVDAAIVEGIYDGLFYIYACNLYSMCSKHTGCRQTNIAKSQDTQCIYVFMFSDMIHFPTYNLRSTCSATQA